jgi:hypothetical protein
MKRIAWLSSLLVCSAILHAQSPTPAKEMNGTICYSRCVIQQADTATCNPACAEKSGMAVFVDDEGNVRQIINQDVCKSHVGKRVKVTVIPEKPKIIPTREDWLMIEKLHDAGSSQ